jgi:hypothetical protein
MNWIIVAQSSGIILNILSTFLSIYLNKKTRKEYAKYSANIRKEMKDHRDDYEFHMKQLIEEIELLKTNEGLYDLRKDNEKYKVYLSLLRRNKNK